MSYDPSYMVKCPICKGKGRIESAPCPYPPDTEADCKDCHLSGSCGETTYCGCDDGYVTENERRSLLKEMHDE